MSVGLINLWLVKEVCKFCLQLITLHQSLTLGMFFFPRIKQSLIKRNTYIVIVSNNIVFIWNNLAQIEEQHLWPTCCTMVLFVQ